MWEKKVMQVICCTFKISSHCEGTLKYIRLNVTQATKSVFMNHHGYISTLRTIAICQERTLLKNGKLTSEEQPYIRYVGGKCLLITTRGGPDAAFNSRLGQ